MRPTTERGRVILTGLILLAVGLAIGLPPIALWGPGAGLAVPGALLFGLALVTPPETPEAER